MIINSKKLPDFIIVGVQKAGTSSIADYLNQHPEIGISTIKEPNFFPYYNKEEREYIKLKEFNKKANSFDIITDIDEYSDLFPTKSIRGEASTHNFYYAKNTIENIKKIYGNKSEDLKIIISLRHPLERAFSAWSMFVRKGDETRSFSQALKESYQTSTVTEICDFDYYGFSLYAESLNNFKKNFKNIKIVFFDELKNDSIDLSQELYRFLGVNSNFTPDVSVQINPSGKPKSRTLYNTLIKPNVFKEVIKPIIPMKLRRKLKTKLQKNLLKSLKLAQKDRDNLNHLFYEDIEKLEVLLNKDLSKWKK